MYQCWIVLTITSTLPTADDKHHVTAHRYNAAETSDKKPLVALQVDGIQNLWKSNRPLHLLLNNLN